MKKLGLGLGIIGVLFLCAGCDSLLDSFKNEEGQTTNELNLTNTSIQTMSLQAVSSVEVSMDVLKSSAKLSTVESSDEIELFKNAEVILDNSLVITELEVDKDGYILEYSIVYEEKPYLLYIKEQTTKTEEDEDEIENETSFSGIVVYEENEYTFKAEKSSEVEKDETEEEIEFQLYFNENSYIEVKNEIEVEANEKEKEFAYKIVQNGVEVDSYKAKRSVEDNHEELQIKKNNVILNFKKYIENEVEYLEVKNKTTDTKNIYRKDVNEQNEVTYILIIE